MVAAGSWLVDLPHGTSLLLGGAAALYTAIPGKRDKINSLLERLVEANAEAMFTGLNELCEQQKQQKEADRRQNDSFLNGAEKEAGELLGEEPLSSLEV